MKIRFVSVLFVLMLMSVAQVIAQTPPPDPSLIGAALDGFSVLLVVGGAAYGAIRMNRNKK
jgi:hypothetical protein